MADETLPSPTRMCHLTGFTKKCGLLVSSRKCERWRILTVQEGATGDGGRIFQKGDCIDDWAFYFGIRSEIGMTQLTASTDIVREQGRTQHTESMAVVLRQLMTPSPEEKFQHTLTLIDGRESGK